MITELRRELPQLWVEPVRSTEPVDLFLESDGRSRTSSYPGVAATPAQVTLAELTTYLVTASPLFCVHAGVVSGSVGALAVPGTSGHGKTTLTAALVGAGFGYLSDEVLAVDRATGQLTPFPRPLAVDARSWRILGRNPSEAPEPGSEKLIQPAELGPAGVPGFLRILLIARRRPGPTRLEPLTAGAGVQALLDNSFNHYQDGRSSFRTAVDAVRGAEVWQLDYPDAVAAATELAARWL